MLLVGAVLLAYFVLPPVWGAVAVVLAAAIEIGETAFWIRLSRRRRVQVGAETLIGAVAVVASPCRPDGQVRLSGELWGARCDEGADAGEPVVVTGRNGLTLVVERAEGRK
jgi:membrane protein implicated in regulation of membrane protease activity